MFLPQLATQDVAELSAPAAAGGLRLDVLPQLLAPCFADDGATLDGATVEREAAGRLKNMMLGS